MIDNASVLNIIAMALIGNMGAIIMGYVKLSERITRLETHMKHLLQHDKRAEDKELGE